MHDSLRLFLENQIIFQHYSDIQNKHDSLTKGEMMVGEKQVVKCPVQGKINEYCSCPKTECKNHGICCECVLDHKNRKDVAFHINFPHCLRDQLGRVGYKP